MMQHIGCMNTEFKKVYGDKKVFKCQLLKENNWIHLHLSRNNLLDKYCKIKNRSLKEALEEFKTIYGWEKPGRSQLFKENNWIYDKFRRNNLLDKYCEKSKIKNRSLQDAIEEFKKVYGDKKQKRYKLQKENVWIYHHFRKNNLLDKYCKSKRSN